MKLNIFLITILLSNLSFAQIGGEHVYQFLDLDFNSRSMGLAGDFNLAKDDDINLAVSNPALISSNMDKNLSLNHAIYPSGINYGQIVYGKALEKGNFTGHLRYVEYGKFNRTDVNGEEQGTFTAGDYAIGIGYGRQLNKLFSIGANVNAILSHYESYSSFGVSTDIAAMYFNDETNISAVVMARNVGVQIKGYTKQNHEQLPIEILAGISYKFHHAPFRFSMMGHDLTDWDLSYNIPGATETIDALTGDTIPVFRATFVEKLFRHLNFSAEISPTDNFSVRLGYNFNRRKSLGVDKRMGISGFSAGVGFKVKKFEFDYALAVYSAAGASNMFTISTNINQWYKKE